MNSELTCKFITHIAAHLDTGITPGVTTAVKSLHALRFTRKQECPQKENPVQPSSIEDGSV